MARLVLLDDPEDLHQRLVVLDDRVAEQDLDLPMAALLGQRDHPAQPLEQTSSRMITGRFELVDPGGRT